MELKDIDLNLLVVFNGLLAERKVSKVAENLGLGQPAVSNALARLHGCLTTGCSPARPARHANPRRLQNNWRNRWGMRWA